MYIKCLVFVLFCVHLVQSQAPGELPSNSTFLATLSHNNTESPASPLPGYIRISNVGCYKFHTAAQTWPDAKRMCEHEGGHLVVLNSRAEADAIVALMQENRLKLTGADYAYGSWVGVRESNTTQNDFYTIFGEPLSATGFSRWSFRSPSRPSLGDVVFLSSSSGELVDFYASWNQKYGFTCEQPLC